MNTKQRIQSLKDYLKGKEGKFVQIIYKRYQRRVRDHGKLTKLDKYLVKDGDVTGQIQSIEDKSITLLFNGELTLSIKFGVIERAYIQPRLDSLRIKFRLYYKN
jgi:hypothetical protein